MKLAIVVVYLVSEEDHKLLDLHLRQIQKHTSVPYTIYAGAHRLLPGFRARLILRPEIKICTLVSTDLRGAEENSFYLEQLVKIAIDDNATHVVTLHLDSFPIRDGWAEELASRATGKAFAAINHGPYTACLFFNRNLYLDHRPHFLLSDSELASQAYRDFSLKHTHVHHSGIGYFFRAFTDGLEWYPLVESYPNAAFGVVYDGLVFHLHGSERLGVLPHISILNNPIVARVLVNTRRLARVMIPRRARRALWEKFGDLLSRLDKPAMALAKQELFENPDAYFERIQTTKN